MVNLGVHQSSSVSVLGNTEYFSTDLQRSDGVWLTAELWKTPPGWYLPEAEGVWLCPCDFVSPSITVMECLARCRCLGNHLQMLSPSFQRDPPTERPCPSNGCKNKEIHKWVLAFITCLLQQELRNSLAELIFFCCFVLLKALGCWSDAKESVCWLLRNRSNKMMHH